MANNLILLYFIVKLLKFFPCQINPLLCRPCLICDVGGALEVEIQNPGSDLLCHNCIDTRAGHEHN